MKTLLVARKLLIESWREPALGLLLLIFPALLIVVYFYGYGQSGQGMAQLLNIQILNQDQGPAGERLAQAIQQAAFDGKPVFKMSQAISRMDAETALREGTASLVLVIPLDFSQQLAQVNKTPVHLTLVGDPASDLYVFAQGFLTEIVQVFTDQAAGWTQETPAAYTFIPGTGKLSDFQFGVPGTLVFGILFGALSTALFMVREEVRGTLKRLRLTRLSAFELLGGTMAAQALLALLQMFLALGTAVLFGFQSPGSLVLAGGIGVLVSLIASGCGFMTACFARNDGDAANFSMIFIAPLAFLSGSVFPMPAAPLFQLWGRTFQTYDLLPTTHAANALRRVLIYGDSLSDVALEVSLLAIFSILILIAGALVYRRLKLS